MNARAPIAPSVLSAASAERLVTDIELAARLSISRRYVHVLRSRGQLRAVRLGGAVRFPLNENLARVLEGVCLHPHGHSREIPPS